MFGEGAAYTQIPPLGSHSTAGGDIGRIKAELEPQNGSVGKCLHTSKCQDHVKPGAVVRAPIVQSLTPMGRWELEMGDSPEVYRPPSWEYTAQRQTYRACLQPGGRGGSKTELVL